MRRLLSLAALTALLVGALAACSSPPTSKGFSDAKAATLTGYVLATGKRSVSITGSAKGAVTLGSSLEALLPDAVKTVLKLTGTKLGFAEQYSAKADMEVAADGDNQKVTFTYTNLNGNVSLPIPGQSKEYALTDLSGGAPTLTVTYTLKPDGSVATSGKDPVADTFVLVPPPLSGFPTLPKGGAAANSTWTTQKSLPDPFSFVKSPISWNGSFAVSEKDNSATVAATTGPLGTLEVSTKDLITTVNDIFGLKINDIDVTASFAPTGKITQKTILSVPAQQLNENSPNVDLSGQLSVSGSSLPQGLKPGPIGFVEFQSTTALTSAGK